MEKYNQFYTSSLFNIENNINYKLKTIFINVFTDEDLEVFNKIVEKQVIYNSKLHFFNCLDIVNKVIQSDIPIYSDNIKIRKYLFENGNKPKFIEKKYIQVHKNINFDLFDQFEISSNEQFPLVIKLDGDLNLIIERLKKKLPTIIVDKINILEIDQAICSKRLLYIENMEEFIKNITGNLYVSDGLQTFNETFKKCYLKNGYNNNGICIFFGMYTDKDIQILEKHNGIKFLIWGGNDCNWNYEIRCKNFEIINKIPDLYHIAISKDIQERLNLKNIINFYMNLNYDNNSLKKLMNLCNIKINLEYEWDYNTMITKTNGDCLNELNLINNLINQNCEIYVNQKPINNINTKKPFNLSIIRGLTAMKRINIPQPKYSHCIPFDKNCDGIYCITQSIIDAIKDKNSLMYPHVYDINQFNEINSKPILLLEQKIEKSWYNWMSNNEINNLRKKYYPNPNTIIICICGRISTNNYPKTLIEGIKILRNNGFDIQLLVLGNLVISPYRLTKEEYDEITSFNWVKSFIVEKKDVLNYYRICDILASTYRDYCNVVGGCNKIKEYLLCDKPILCSRGKERERELGINYFGLYDCNDCYKIPPLSWLKNMNEGKNYNFTVSDTEINDILNIITRVIFKNKNYIKNKVSIIVPLYKNNDTIIGTIDSIKNQTYKNIEIIIINDGCEEKYKNLINYIKKNKSLNIKLFKNSKNIGVYNTLNYGLLFSSGEYITCIGSDDKYKNNRIELDINNINDKNDINILAVCSKYCRVNNFNKIIDNFDINGRYGDSMFTFKRDAFIKNGFYYDTRFGGDSEYVNRLIHNFGKNVIKYIDNIGYFALQKNDNNQLTKIYNDNERIKFSDNFKKLHLEKKYIQSNFINKFNINTIINNNRKIKILLITYNGGLSFMNEYIQYIKSNPYIDLLIDDQYNSMCNTKSHIKFINAKYLKIMKKKIDDFNPDIIYCEWASYLLYELANIKKPHQKLICRMHRFDIYLIENWNVKYENIDKIICINDYFTKLLKKRNLKCKNIVTINNYFNIKNINRNINSYNYFNIGIIGIEKEVKRLDIALNILIKLRKINSNFKLFSKGNKLVDTNIIKELDITNYFHEDHSSKNNISVNEWIIKNNITHILSVSNIESFHYSIISAIETDCNYYITNWINIAKKLWNPDNIYNNIDDLINGIIKYNDKSNNNKKLICENNKKYLLSKFTPENEKIFLDNILEVL